jgi:ribonuclease HII
LKTRGITAPLFYEEELYCQGALYVGGIDEAGRGPLAGPVTACAVILPQGLLIPGVNDSKALSEKRRQTLSHIIKKSALYIGYGWASAEYIDKFRIVKAVNHVMETAISNLKQPPDALLIDGPKGLWQPVGAPATFIIRGDSLSHSIASASIMAKVARDAYMLKMHEKYPMYGFNQHKGYGTKKHFENIKKYGLCPIHRKSYLRKYLHREGGYVE